MGAEDVRKAQSLEDIGQQLRALMREDGVSVTFRLEAEDDMEQLGLTRPDVVNILKGAKVTSAELKGQLWRYMAEARTTEGVPVGMPVTIYEEERRIRIARVFTLR